MNKFAFVENFKFSKFENTELYTRHYLRRPSLTFLAGTEADIEEFKLHGGWKLSIVLEGYLDKSIINKTYCCRKYFSVKKILMYKYQVSVFREVANEDEELKYNSPRIQNSPVYRFLLSTNKIWVKCLN